MVSMDKSVKQNGLGKQILVGPKSAVTLQAFMDAKSVSRQPPGDTLIIATQKLPGLGKLYVLVGAAEPLKVKLGGQPNAHRVCIEFGDVLTNVTLRGAHMEVSRGTSEETLHAVVTVRVTVWLHPVVLLNAVKLT